MEEVLRSVFPIGILGINGDTKIKAEGTQFDFVQAFKASNENVIVAELAKAAVEIMKSGKTAVVHECHNWFCLFNHWAFV